MNDTSSTKYTRIWNGYGIGTDCSVRQEASEGKQRNRMLSEDKAIMNIGTSNEITTAKCRRSGMGRAIAAVGFAW